MSIDAALAHHQAGRLAEAERAYRQVLDADPRNVDALHLLGVLSSQRGEHEQAIRLIDRALEVSPGFAEALLNRGNALQHLKRNEEALQSFDKALAIKPGAAVAWTNRGNVLKALDRPEEALASLEKAVEIDPASAEAHFNRAVVLQALGRQDEALRSYGSALGIQPNYVQALNNSGLALEALERPTEALAMYAKAAAIKPDYAGALCNLGRLLHRLMRHEEALQCIDNALAVDPANPDALLDRGVVLQSMARDEEALRSYEAALALRPGYAPALNGRGNALRQLGRSAAALACYQQAIAASPDYADALYNRGLVLYDLGRLQEAVASYRLAIKARDGFVEAQSNLLFTLNYLADQPRQSLLEDARAYGEMVARKARPFASWQGSREPGRRLKIGWVSGDFRNHAVGYFAEGVLAALSRRAAGSLELFGYSNASQHDAVTDRIRASLHAWRAVGALADEQLARRIHDDGIDILVDLAGHTAGSRLASFAWRAAPVQVAWLGYFATTGVREIDYLIADPCTLPPAEERYFTEKIWRLPETRLCFTPPDERVDVSPLPALAAGQFTFGCFNNLAKLNPAVVGLWAKVLMAVPRSRLFLKARLLDEEEVRQDISRRFAAEGIDPRRLVLEGPSPRADYLAAYRRVDITLDPFPFTGGTTTAESLWMGVPVLTLAGDRFVSRQGAGLLTQAGLGEWIAADAGDYVARAKAHAANLAALSALRGALRQRVLASPIFDAARFAGHLERALRGIWSEYCSARS